MNAINANNKLNVNVLGTKKATEKLSSGFAINRAGDNASGLAVSEKMRSQIRGLGQAINNANDGISLIQTAEGGLNETHSILQRMRELAVQSANGTYQDDTDREAIQLEVDALKSEIDRISSSTEYNKIKLLDGSLGGSGTNKGEFGPKYGVLLSNAAGDLQAGTVLTSSIAGVSVSLTTGASGKGGENAAWDATGKTLTINLANGQTYTQAQIDDLIKNAKVQEDSTQSASRPDITLKLGTGVVTASGSSSTGVTVAGQRASTGTVSLAPFLVGTTTTEDYADLIEFTSNNYGVDTRAFTISTDVAPGKEKVDITTPDANPNTKDGVYVLHLSTGKEYTEEDISNILKKAGLDYSISLTSSKAPDDGIKKFYANTSASVSGAALGGGVTGQGVGKDKVDGGGEGLVFQIGANGVADQRVSLSVDDMSASALGVANADVSTRDAANDSINTVDAAVKKVSMQRAGLGALQNRLEYTVNNLTTTQENLTAAESQIRDTDMAKEMINYTKFNILQQAAQAMLAQANQAPQAVLQLLG